MSLLLKNVEENWETGSLGQSCEAGSMRLLKVECCCFGLKLTSMSFIHQCVTINNLLLKEGIEIALCWCLQNMFLEHLYCASQKLTDDERWMFIYLFMFNENGNTIFFAVLNSRMRKHIYTTLFLSQLWKIWCTEFIFITGLIQLAQQWGLLGCYDWWFSSQAQNTQIAFPQVKNGTVGLWAWKVQHDVKMRSHDLQLIKLIDEENKKSEII